MYTRIIGEVMGAMQKFKICNRLERWTTLFFLLCVQSTRKELNNHSGVLRSQDDIQEDRGSKCNAQSIS